MKKIILNILMLFLILNISLLCACGSSKSGQENADADEAPQLDFSNIVTVVSQPTAAPGYTSAETYVPVSLPGNSVSSVSIEYTPAPTPVPVYTPEPTAVPTPIPTEIPAVSYVTITKSPISETVASGGTAVFTSYADNASSVNWIVASPDRQTIYTLADAPNHFPGLQVSGVYSNVVTLTNIPAIMNGWQIQSYFEGNGGPKYSADAYIFVLSETAPPGNTIPGSMDESLVLQNAQKCVSAVKSYSYLGYNISDMENYSYTFDNTIGGSSSFNVSFSNSNYKIVCEFNATSTDYSPVSAAVFDTSWKVIQAYSFINDSTLEDLHTRVLCEYCR